MERFVRLESMEGFYRTLHPSLTVVLITKCPNGRLNAMPASWNMPVAEEPPSVAVSVYRGTYTFQCLEHHPQGGGLALQGGEDMSVYRLFAQTLVWSWARASLAGHEPAPPRG